MEITVRAGQLARIETEAVMIGCFEDTKEVEGSLASLDALLEGAVSGLVAQGEIKGKSGEVTIIHSLGRLPARRLVVVGLGKKGKLTPDVVRGAVAEGCRLLQKKGVKDVAVAINEADLPSISAQVAGQMITEGALLGTYTFRRHITKEAGDGELEKVIILVSEQKVLPEVEQGCGKGRILAEAARLARDMVNEPANYMTPTRMAEIATELSATYGLEIEVMEREQMQELGMGGLLGVAQGSQQPPKLIILKYRGNDSSTLDIALVGKGVTFDSGGISIKPSEKMDEMKTDMAGGAAAIAALTAISRFKPSINVAAIVPATENLPSGNALKPGDILTTLSGKTIEVLNTDAEGRLILSDALAYANKLEARFIIDAATLTGACIVALGRVCSGAFGNNQELIDQLVAAGEDAGELIWQMPMYGDYRELLKSEVADIKNVGNREAGSITGAKFLEEFVGDTPWVHLDIAGTARSERERHYLTKGATGVPVRTLVNLVLSLAEKPPAG